jgi:hypothetical protein
MEPKFETLRLRLRVASESSDSPSVEAKQRTDSYQNPKIPSLFVQISHPNQTPYGLEHGLHGADPPASLGPLGLGALVPRREVSDQGESR